MGRSDAETRRLEAQAQLYDPATRTVLEEAGLRPGMTALDVGCGAGDVAMIAARLVGPSGHVLAVDVDSSVLERARLRAHESGCHNIEFIQGDARELVIRGAFDAVVGRLVLLHQRDPSSKLAAICRGLPRGAHLQASASWTHQCHAEAPAVGAARPSHGLDF